jgi:eukaryotic-like serine/threonine-protein kinase
MRSKRTPGPAERLEGVELSDGWTVGKKLSAAAHRSDNSFTVAYETTGPNGEEGWLKATDYSQAHTSEDFHRTIEEIAATYRHERDLVKLCETERMSRIVRAITSGETYLEGSELPVMYIIFERASGDVRHSLGSASASDPRWRMRILHHAAVGLHQLHRRRAFHRNFKPAHLLDFGDNRAKITGLSSAWHGGRAAPLRNEQMPGDAEYAAPECLYGFSLPDIEETLRARDMYLFGSLILFLYQQVTTTTALLHELDAPHHPGSTTESFNDVLPYLVDGFDQVVDSLAAADPSPPAELLACYRELCHPDPRQRGHPRAHAMRHGSSYSLERYIGRLSGLLAREIAEATRQAA